MSSNGVNITLSQVSNTLSISEYDSCEESGCRIRFDDIPERVVVRPEELGDDDERADYAVFFPEPQTNRPSGIGTPLDSAGSSNSNAVDYVAAIELKSTFDDRKKVKSQIEGAIDFIIDTLTNICQPWWEVKCLCLVVPRTSNINLRKNPITFDKHLRGKRKIFEVVTLRNNQELVSVFERYGEDVGTPL
ncbi:hypothetical protein [Halorubrum vacuolatum]|uniref:Uncharacterized protein n=1 Tax=Halorubrum vacuolatum TaxID=63740 RepID=A0A238WRQ4_HALVU|nr:hypothetical protein [Halorubrum vacuolatum]SNR49192.1 hypothetical protein SAMN06264855_109122 [Halorubrum vacuolatum]